MKRGRVLGANDRIGVGFIGVGGRGQSHVNTVKKLGETGELVQLVAVCDAYGFRLNEVAKATGAKAYRKHLELLADPRVDVVCVVPRQLEEGREVLIAQPVFELALGEPVLFPMYSSTVRGDDRIPVETFFLRRL